MVDISKGATRVQDKEIRSNLTPVEIRELLRDANISEIKAKLPAGIDKADIENFLRSQYANFRQQIIQDGEVKAMAGSYPSPGHYKHNFRAQRVGLSVAPMEVNLFNEEMRRHMDSGRFRAMSASKGIKSDESGDVKPMTEQELLDSVDESLMDVDDFMGETWSMIMDAQMMQDMQSRMGQIKGEVDRIIALVKQGVVGPEFALIALAKVNQTKNGCMMVWLGKKVSHINDSMNRVAADLQGANAFDQGNLYMGQRKMQEGTQNMNLLTTDIQKIMQDCSSVLDHVKNSMDMMQRTRQEIVRKLSLPGG